MYRIYKALSTIFTLPIKSPEVGGASRPSVWFHIASLGEINAAGGLIDKFLENGYLVFATVFTSSGYKRIKTLYKDNLSLEAVRFPYDKPSFIKKVFDKKHIRAVIIVETELWPNLINISSNYTKLYLINARLSDKNMKRMRGLKGFYRDLLSKFNLIFPMSTFQYNRFKALGVPEDKLSFVGNTKVDGLGIDPSELIKREEIGIPENEFVVVFGSVRGREIPHIVSITGPLMEMGIGIIIAPRHLSRVGLLEEKLKEYNIPYTKRTKSKYKKDKVYIVDTLGELKRFYYLANVVFVGGTLENYGGHNVLEPAIFAKPVLFGPFVHNIMDEAMGLKKAGGGFEVKDSEELKNRILMLYKERKQLVLSGQNALQFVQKLKEFSSKVYDRIKEDLDEEREYL